MVKQKKIALNTFDDRRCYTDKYNSIPWGHNPKESSSIITHINVCKLYIYSYNCMYTQIKMYV